MKTFFNVNFQLRARALDRVNDIERLGGRGRDGDRGFVCACCSVILPSAALSSGFQKQASFLLFRMVARTSYLLQIPHTVTFCRWKSTFTEYIPAHNIMANVSNHQSIDICH